MIIQEIAYPCLAAALILMLVAASRLARHGHPHRLAKQKARKDA
jgi:hypothetical protein